MRIDFHVGQALVTVLHVPSDTQPVVDGTPLVPGWYWVEWHLITDPDGFMGPFEFAGLAISDATEKVSEVDLQTLPSAAQPASPRIASSRCRVIALAALVAGAILGVAAGAAIAGREPRESGATVAPGTVQPAAAGAIPGAHGGGAATGIPGRGIAAVIATSPGPDYVK